MMTPEQRALVVELSLGRISAAEFVKRAGFDPLAESDFVPHALKASLESRSNDELACVMLLAFRYELLKPELAPLLAELLLEPWHRSHENLAYTLQQLRDPRTAPALADAGLVKHDYLAYDNSYALARKCCWALADIGTAEAHGYLERLASNPDPVIAGYARERLDNWQHELHRKAGSNLR
jgi:hypothetical protein